MSGEQAAAIDALFRSFGGREGREEVTLDSALAALDAQAEEEVEEEEEEEYVDDDDEGRVSGEEAAAIDALFKSFGGREGRIDQP